jgi:predicted secreted protein
MDKKVTYYIIAAIVLIATVGIIIAMQNKKQEVETPIVKNPVAVSPVKSETQAAQDIAKEAGALGMPLRITMDDNGQTVSLTPGKALVMMLGTDYKWTITSSDDKVVAKKNITLSDARAQAVYQIVGPGKAVLSATGACVGKASCTPANFKLNVESVITDNSTPEELVK